MQWRWARAHHIIDITGEGGALATRKSRRAVYRSAVCGEVLQAEGEAYAEFTWLSGRFATVGVARAGFDPRAVEDGLCTTADGWMYECDDGGHYHNNSQTPWASGSKQRIREGETVGLLLRRGSLSVHIGGRQVGVMCTGLSGALVWATDLHDSGASVRIARKPVPTAPKVEAAKSRPEPEPEPDAAPASSDAAGETAQWESIKSQPWGQQLKALTECGWVEASTEYDEIDGLVGQTVFVMEQGPGELVKVAKKKRGWGPCSLRFHGSEDKTMVILRLKGKGMGTPWLYKGPDWALPAPA
eukprot:COSAG04_NODE_1358_length_7102_cov_9.598601_7_plen_300_part_00